MRIKASNAVGTSVAPLQACNRAASQLLGVSILQACTLAKRCAPPPASCLRSRGVGKSLTSFQLSRILYNSDTQRDSLLADGHGEKCPRTQWLLGFRAIFVKKSCLVECTRGVAGVWGSNFDKKSPAHFVFVFGLLDPRPHWA